MSTTFTTATATFRDAKFDLATFCTERQAQCVREQNFIAEEYGTDPDNENLVDHNFVGYFEKDPNDGVTYHLKYDNQEHNLDVYGWLIDRVIETLSAPFMRVDWVFLNPRLGDSCYSEIRTRDGDVLGFDDLVNAYFNTYNTLEDGIIVDTRTGTILNAEHCVYINPEDLTESQWGELETAMERSDSEIGQIAEEHGSPIWVKP